MATEKPKNRSFKAVTSRYHAQINLETLRPELDAFTWEGKDQEAIERLKDWITGNPLEERAFLLLGELYQNAKMTNAAIVAFERALQLKELSAQYQPSPSLLRLREIESGAANDPTSRFFPGFSMRHNDKRETRDAFLDLHKKRKAAL